MAIRVGIPMPHCPFIVVTKSGETLQFMATNEEGVRSFGVLDREGNNTQRYWGVSVVGSGQARSDGVYTFNYGEVVVGKNLIVDLGELQYVSAVITKIVFEAV